MPRIKYDKAAIIADWKTGKYTERVLAGMHKVSAGTIHNIVTGIEKTIGPLISKQVEINQELAVLNEHELSRFKQEVDTRTKQVQFYADVGVKIAISAMKVLDGDERPNVFEHKALAETVLRSKEITLGKDVAPAAAIQINNTSGQVGARKMQDLTDDELHAIINS